MGLGFIVADYEIEKIEVIDTNYIYTQYLEGNVTNENGQRVRISYIPPYFPLIEIDLFDSTFMSNNDKAIVSEDYSDSTIINIRPNGNAEKIQIEKF